MVEEREPFYMSEGPVTLKDDIEQRVKYGSNLSLYVPGSLVLPSRGLNSSV